MISLIASIPLSLKFGIPQRQICLFHTLTYPWQLTVRGYLVKDIINIAEGEIKGSG
jgi:hypothetical protein